MRGWHVCRHGRARQDKSGFREIVVCLTISTCCIVGKGEFGSDSSQLVTNLYRGANRASVRPILGFRPYRRLPVNRLPVNYQLVDRLIRQQADQPQRFISACGDDSFDACPTSPGNLVSLTRKSVSHLHPKTQSDYAEQNRVEGSDNNVRNTLCGIVRHSTLWVRPEVVAEIQFMEWTGADHLRHTKFVRLRDAKEPLKVIKET